MSDARHDTRGASSALDRDTYRVSFFACVITDQSVRKHPHTSCHQWDRPLALMCTTWKTTRGASLVAVATRDAFGMAMAFDFAGIIGDLEVPDFSGIGCHWDPLRPARESRRSSPAGPTLRAYCAATDIHAQPAAPECRPSLSCRLGLSARIQLS